MTDFDNDKLRRLDLTVLLIFLALMRTRKAARVADELGLTNSSISHALRRLRDVFGDELFLRRPHGLSPTAFAEQIEPDVRRAVEAIQTALAGPAAFDPARARGLIRIAANDREVAGLIPSAFARLTADAPGLKVSIRSLGHAASLQRLADGSLDMAIGYFPDAGADFERTTLRTEGYAVAARADHPLFAEPMTLDAYCEAAHVLVSADGSMDGIVDRALAELGRARHVALAIPAFLPALSVLSRTDLIATLPEMLIRDHAHRFGLGVAAPPLGIRPFDVSVLRHRRNLRDPMLTWCLARVAAG